MIADMTETLPLALVTGAAGDIGKALCERLSHRGYQLILAAHTDESAAATAELFPGSIPVACDHTNADEVRALCERIEGEWRDRLQVLVCNAGVIIPGDLADVTAESIDTHLDINLRSPAQLLRSAAIVCRARGDGHLVAIASLGGVMPMPGSAMYSASKFGLRGLLSALNAEVHSDGVKVSGIYPGAIDTKMLRFEARSGGSALNFLSKIHEVDEVADALEKALDKGRLEVYVPYSESLSARFAAGLPWTIRPLMPMLNRVGERGRRKFLKRID